MKVQIIFTTAAKPKIVEVDDVYTKGGLLCLQYPDGMIVKYPLGNIWSVCHMHGQHMESERNKDSIEA